MKHTGLLLLFATALLFCPHCRAQVLTPYHGVAPNTYNFWVYTPEDYSIEPGSSDSGLSAGNEPLPLVVFLHGASLKGTDLNRVRRYGTLHALEMGRRIDAIVVAPQCNSGSWSPSRIMNTIEWVEQHYNIDTCRRYVLGMSLGGYGTIDFAAAYPHRIAAAMAICGGGTARDFCGLTELPLWILHGTADRAVPIAQSKKVIAAMERCSTTDRLIFTPLEGYNHTQPAKILYMSETYDWLFQHRLDDPYRPVSRSFDIGTANIPHAYNSIDRSNAKKVRIAHTAKAHTAVADTPREPEVDQPSGSAPQYYTIKKGDTLCAIAKRHHTTVAQICKLNNIKPTTTLRIGRRLRVR